MNDLSRHDRKAIGCDIKTAQDGWPLGMPLIRKLESGLWKIRSSIDRGIARAISTVEDDVMVLLHGFVKKSAKIPSTDLQVAIDRRSNLRGCHY
jgi:phage-related protein